MRDKKGRFIKGHNVPQEWKKSWSKKNTGYRHTEEAKRKISIHSTGKNNPAWIDGRSQYSKCGHKRVLYNGKLVLEHQLIWCITNQVPIIPHGCCIHHLNFDKLDNRPENLVLLPHDLHTKLHWIYEKESGIDRLKDYKLNKSGGI